MCAAVGNLSSPKALQGSPIQVTAVQLSLGQMCELSLINADPRQIYGWAKEWTNSEMEQTLMRSLLIEGTPLRDMEDGCVVIFASGWSGRTSWRC